MPIGLNDADHDSKWRYDRTNEVANYTFFGKTSSTVQPVNLVMDAGIHRSSIVTVEARRDFAATYYCVDNT